jgi:hypothetical protein
LRLSDAYGEYGDRAAGERIIQQAIAAAPANVASTITMMTARNSALTFLDFTQPATLAAFATLLADATRVLGAEHRVAMTILGNYSAVAHYNQQHDLAKQLALQRLAIFKRRFPDDHESVLNNQVTIAAMLYSAKDFAATLAFIDEAIAAFPRQDLTPVRQRLQLAHHRAAGFRSRK